MDTHSEYRELLVRNQILNKTSPNSKEQREVGAKLLAIELRLSSKEIIENTKIAFPKVHSD